MSEGVKAKTVYRYIYICIYIFIFKKLLFISFPQLDCWNSWLHGPRNLFSRLFLPRGWYTPFLFSFPSPPTHPSFFPSFLFPSSLSFSPVWSFGVIMYELFCHGRNEAEDWPMYKAQDRIRHDFPFPIGFFFLFFFSFFSFSPSPSPTAFFYFNLLGLFYRPRL